MNQTKKNLLVIDDSVSIRTYIRGLLEEEGYNVVEARDGEEGIQIYKNSSIDLIVTDVFMPNRTGFEVVLEVKKDNPDVKVIVLSDGGKDNFTNQSGIVEEFGAKHFLQKSKINDELVSLVRKVLEE